MVSRIVSYPPRTAPDKFVVRARDSEGRTMRFPSIKAQPNFDAAKKLAFRVARRPDTYDVRILRVPAAR